MRKTPDWSALTGQLDCRRDQLFQGFRAETFVHGAETGDGARR